MAIGIHGFGFFCRGLSGSRPQQASSQQAKEVAQLREEYRAVLRKPNALIVLDELFFNPYMTVAGAGKVLNKTHPPARVAISVLEEEIF